jgi:Glycosyl hydrolases family 2, sugar binding domain/Glycosyl hydrolases family 2, TIM barrel domain/Glycosyl hydrolases family 2
MINAQRSALNVASSLIAGLTVVVAAQSQPPAAPVQSKLMTNWAANVKPDNVLAEYPRPQMTRDEWQTLNGSWQYAIAPRDGNAPQTYTGTILVPFAIESVLSGVRTAVTPDQYLWYRRTFQAPHRPAGGRVLLHFGAVDWEAVVSINGKQVGEHRGGYDPFTFDITDALRPADPQEIVVRVWDPTDKGPQPRGKQVLQPHSIWYTAVTGIWQTAWLEAVPARYISGLRIDPDVDAGVVHVQVTAAGTTSSPVRVEVREGIHQVGAGGGTTGERIAIKVPNAKLWSPSTPFLYDLTIHLGNDDIVNSYVGMRKIAVGRDSSGVNRLLLNGTPLFEYGQLDQGWWPDGLYTAPTDEALRYDIETQKHMGFNTIRKHVKVEPERWYFECDRMGMLVWQDMPSGDNNTPEGIAGFGRELEAVVGALRNHPSIVMWVPFNEGWGQHDTEKYVARLKQLDPTRLVNNTSGWSDKGVGSVVDGHAYPGPAAPPPETGRAAVIGEFGGLGLPIEGHTWLDKGNWGYRSFTTPDALGKAYRDLLTQLRLQIANGAAAAIYTQTTDVEIEVNGLMTYDRAVTKIPASQLASWNAALYEAPPKLTTIVPAADREPSVWRYTTTRPEDTWMRADFDASAWSQGQSGFGRANTRWGHAATEWTTSDLWLRRTANLSSTTFAAPYLKIFHDDGAEVYLNGELAATLTGASGGYIFVPIADAARKTLRAGANTIAVHVHQERGGQFIDVGIVDVGGS